MKNRFAHNKYAATSGLGGSFAIEIHRTPAVPKVLTPKPAKISGKVTTLGDLLDRAIERMERMRG